MKDGFEQSKLSKDNSFKEKIQQVVQEGKFEYAMDISVLRTALETNDAELWEIIILAIAQREQIRFSPVKDVSDWEKLVITMNSKVKNYLDDVDFMSRNGIDEKRRLVARKPSIDFRKLATEKTVLFIICSPVKTSLYHFSNFIYDTAIKVLLSYAQEFEDGKLLRKVRLFFDDFGCTAAPIQSFAEHISIFRSAGLSAMLLIQSESMLQSIYGEEKATTILNNCASYVYFPGGMDRQTCKSVSEQMNMCLEGVMYAPVHLQYRKRREHFR